MFFAVPFFKNLGFLEETLKSLLNQDSKDWVAVVLDDSIDPSEGTGAKACVEKLSDPRISYRKNASNLGLAKNWNQAFELAGSHELMVILHADDRLKSDYCSEIGKLATRYPDAAGFFCKTEIIGGDGRPVFSMADFYKKFLVPRDRELVLKGNDGIAALIPGSFIFCPSICYRLSKIKTERFRTDLRMVLDFEFTLRALEQGKSWVGYYDHPLFEYRRHTQNTTVNLTQNLTRFHEEIALYRNLSERLKTSGQVVLAKKARQMRVVKLNLLFQIVKSLLGFKWASLKKESSLLLEIL